ncbi:MAG: phytanoyl-CoA dioxygenase family protein [Abitibacteriaceae bacterium]|nr:phytanoyl-CoA dioxygenase family protein [Abditibacteriaceae bacterium]MBV9868638.1 phytanoyl-CoA dioxygenase family protein [Abditibacteriaceae bacterium]
MSRPLEDYAAELHTQGYTIIEGVLNRSQTDAAIAALDEIFEREKEIGPQRHWHTDVHQVAYMLPQKHPLFRSFAFDTQVLPLMQLILGKDCVLGSLNGLSMTPGGGGQNLHLDQSETVPGTVLYINALHTLDDFTKANGATRVVPCSQDRPFPRGQEREEIEKEAVYLEAPAGSLIAFNGGLWHAGSRNTTDKPRRAIHAFFHRPWVRPQWDYPRSLSPEVVAELTPEQKRLFGFHARPQWYDYESDMVRHD